MGIRAVTTLTWHHEEEDENSCREDREKSGRQARVHQRRKEHEGNEVWNGTHNIKHEDSAKAMTGLFKWDLVNASKEHGFSISVSRTQKAAFLTNCGQGVGAPEAQTAPEQGMRDDDWKTAARRRLRLRTEESRMCDCSLLKDERGEHTLACQKSPWRTRILTECETASRDKFAEWGPLPTWRESHRSGQSDIKTNMARIRSGWRGSI